MFKLYYWNVRTVQVMQTIRLHKIIFVLPIHATVLAPIIHSMLFIIVNAVRALGF